MKIPLTYSFRNLWTRRLTTLLTMLGVALVVFVFVAALMLANGLRNTLVATGADENAIVIRRSSQSELESFVTREQADIIKTQPEIATMSDGTPLATEDFVTLISLPKRSNNELANVVGRGVSSPAMEMRQMQIKLVEGRKFQTGMQEVIVGKAIQQRFLGCALGGTLHLASTEWKIVGIFDGHGSGFDSEVWGDVEVMMPAFRRGDFSSVTVRLRNVSASGSTELAEGSRRAVNDFEILKTRLESDRRMPVEVKREKQYYDEQSQMAQLIKGLGNFVTFIFSFGAMIGAMITMYAAVSNRTQEIGTLRALGFRRRNVLTAFLVEAVLLSLFGGAIGIVASSALQFITVSTTNWGTFSELAFGFTLSPEIVINALIFSLVMGLAGGFLPAVRASRLKIVEALRIE